MLLQKKFICSNQILVETLLLAPNWHQSWFKTRWVLISNYSAVLISCKNRLCM